MSPIVYTPPKKHECDPPEAVEWQGSTGVPKYPEGTIWECDDCGSRQELVYDWEEIRWRNGAMSSSHIARVIWNRLDD